MEVSGPFNANIADQGESAINEAKKLNLIKPGDKIATIISMDEGKKTESNVMKIAIVN